MTAFPNSSAMDATASGGGPITMLPQIVTGQPEQILSHVTQVLQKATQFITLLEDLDKARRQLGQIWSGHASESALQKISESLQQFEKIIKSIEDGAKLLGEAAKLVEAVQTGYKTVVGAVNPTVAALMSNPWTHAAAQALSTTTSASLRTFINAVGALLNALGATRIGAVLTQLGGVIGALEQLFGGGSSGTGTGTTTPVSANPVTAPGQVSTVASPSGTQAVNGNGGTLPAMSPQTSGSTAASGLQGLLNVPGQATAGVTDNGAVLPTATTLPTATILPAGTVLPAGTTLPPGNEWMTSYTPAALYPGAAGADNSWIPVDPADGSTGTDTGTPSGSDTDGSDTGGSDTGSDSGGAGSTGGGHDATITATKGDLTVTVEVPVDSGQPTDFDLDVTAGSDHLVEHVDIDAAGKVSVS